MIYVTYLTRAQVGYNCQVDSSDGIELLLDVGLERRVRGSADIEISRGGGPWSRRQVLLVRHSPSPHEIDRALRALRPLTDGVLFVVPRAGRALLRAAQRDERIAYAAVEDAVVSFQGETRHRDETRPAGPLSSTRASWTRLAMLRLFALGVAETVSQSEIARRLGVSHVAVAKQLPLPDGLVERVAGGWRVADRGGCWDRFMHDYPGPRGLSVFWAATGDPLDQLRRLERAGFEPGEAMPAVSGDYAADFYAPWRRPSRVVAYVTDQPALQDHGFATVRSAEATVELRTPQDPTILPMSRQWPTPPDRTVRRYVDPLIAAWDLRRSPGGDVDSAVEQLKSRVLEASWWR
jgi:hypothetical protein